VRRQEDGVLPVPCLDPALRGGGVQVARELGVARHRVPGDPDPEPRRTALRLRRADQVAAGREDAGRALGAPLLLELGAEVELGRQQRLRCAVPGVPRGEQPGRRIEVLVGEGDDLHGAVHSQRCPRRP
jgi:hypothetical protein